MGLLIRSAAASRTYHPCSRDSFRGGVEILPETCTMDLSTPVSQLNPNHRNPKPEDPKPLNPEGASMDSSRRPSSRPPNVRRNPFGWESVSMSSVAVISQYLSLPKSYLQSLKFQGLGISGFGA